MLGLILGDAEAEAEKVQLKWLASGEQSELSQSDLIAQTEKIQGQIAELRQASKND